MYLREYVGGLFLTGERSNNSTCLKGHCLMCIRVANCCGTLSQQGLRVTMHLVSCSSILLFDGLSAINGRVGVCVWGGGGGGGGGSRC